MSLPLTIGDWFDLTIEEVLMTSSNIECFFLMPMLEKIIWLILAEYIQL